MASVTVTLAAFVVLAAVLLPTLEERIRAFAEREMNAHVEGYRVALGDIDLHPLRFSVDVLRIRVTQAGSAGEPIVEVPRVAGGIEWRALLHGAVVATVQVDSPRVQLDYQQALREATDAVPLEKKGWQEAVQRLMPIEIDDFRVTDGELVYTDRERSPKPIRVRDLDVHVENIRNVRSQAGLPSPFEVRGRQESGSFSLRGRADFLARPQPKGVADFTLKDLELGRLQPAVERFGVALRDGRVGAQGRAEYAATKQRLTITDATVTALDMDYAYRTPEPTPEKVVARKAAKAATETASGPDVRVEKLAVRDGTVGVINATVRPPYRVFARIGELRVDAADAGRKEKQQIVGKVRFEGAFMGSGRTRAWGSFRPEARGPDFDLALEIEDLDTRTLNDVLRAHAGFDVAEGRFALYSEVEVEGGDVSGYVKPIVVDLDVYDAAQDRGDSFGQKLYEGFVGGVSTILTNPPRDQVATQTSLSGRLDRVDAGTWETLVHLVQNAFFRAILPGFERARH
jgi:hypothetical protein